MYVHISSYLIIKLKGRRHLNNKGGVCACDKVMPERLNPPYNNNIKRLNMYQFCILYFIIIILIEIIIIVMLTICAIFYYM